MKRVVLITGASAGIGAAAAELFLRRGWTVYAGARRVERMQPLSALGAHILYLDVTDQNSAEAAIGEILGSEGRLDVLVNNAGYGALGPVETTPLDRARDQFEVNVFGAMRMAQLAIPAMRAQNRGTIINISSAGGRATTYLGGWYHAAKYALEALSDSLRMELSGFGVNVVLIEPGGVKSDWGAIAADHLERAGEGTVYERDARRVAESYRAVYTGSSRLLTPKEKAARVIVRAAEDPRPRARYLFGFGARGLLMMRALLPARAGDRIIKAALTSTLGDRIKHRRT